MQWSNERESRVREGNTYLSLKTGVCLGGLDKESPEITKKEYDILTCQTDEYGWEDIKDEVPNVLSKEVVEMPLDK